MLRLQLNSRKQWKEEEEGLLLPCLTTEQAFFFYSRSLPFRGKNLDAGSWELATGVNGHLG